MHRKLVVAIVLLFSCVLYANAQPQKPVWPIEFDATFGLFVPGNDTGDQIEVVNSTSHFYYNYNINASVIDYPTNCIPLGFSVNMRSQIDVTFLDCRSDPMSLVF
jgi:hypothetical protein